MGDVHEYFGSVANIFEFHSAEELGITYGSLRNYSLSATKPYKTQSALLGKVSYIKRQEAEELRRKTNNMIDHETLRIYYGL